MHGFIEWLSEVFIMPYWF